MMERIVIENVQYTSMPVERLIEKLRDASAGLKDPYVRMRYGRLSVYGTDEDTLKKLQKENDYLRAKIQKYQDREVMHRLTRADL